MRSNERDLSSKMLSIEYKIDHTLIGMHIHEDSEHQYDMHHKLFINKSCFTCIYAMQQFCQRHYLLDNKYRRDLMLPYNVAAGRPGGRAVGRLGDRAGGGRAGRRVGRRLGGRPGGRRARLGGP